MIFLDTNVFLRFYLRDDKAKAERCKGLLKSVASGKKRAMTSTMVIAEIVWVLERTYRRPRRDVADFVLSLLAVPHLHLAEKAILGSALTTYVSSKADFIDACNAATMDAAGIDVIYTYDRHFASMPKVEAREP